MLASFWYNDNRIIVSHILQGAFYYSGPRNSPNVRTIQDQAPITLRPLFPRLTQEEEENAIENPRFHLSCSATPTLTLSSFNWRSDRSMRVGAYSRSRLSHNALIRRSFVPLLCPSFAHRLVRITSLPQIK